MHKNNLILRFGKMKNLITILGPTATGKTKLAAALAAIIGGEIISADSRQVYRGMDIGTGKDLDDYRYNGQVIPYHLIDIVETGHEYNIFEFQRDFASAFRKIAERNKIPILTGGSGLYLDAVVNGYELTEAPEDPYLRKRLERYTDDELRDKLKSYGPLHNTTDLLDRKRTVRAIEIKEYEKHNPMRKVTMPAIDSVIFGISFERQEIRSRITARLMKRLEQGMIDEVKRLMEQGVEPEKLIFYGLEYKFVTLYLIGELTYEQMFAQLNTAIHQLAKRQITWFRRMEKRGTKIYWIDGTIPLDNKLNTILKVLASIKF